jgi:hypothetical protein
MYVGGTVDIKQGTEGKSFTNDEKTFLFEYTIKKDKERWSQPGTWTFIEGGSAAWAALAESRNVR